MQQCKKIWPGVSLAVAVAGLLASTGCVHRGPRVVPPPPKPDMPPVNIQPVKPAAVVVPEIQPVLVTELPVVTPLPAPGAFKPEGTTYVVKKGDLLSGIAYKHGLSWRDLAEYNSISNPNRLIAGSKLIIPPYAKKRPVASTAIVQKPAASIARTATKLTASGHYVVQPGDSLWLVARKNNTTVAKLKAANQLKGDRLVVGQKLSLPGSSAAPVQISKPKMPKASVGATAKTEIRVKTPVIKPTPAVMPTPAPRVLDLSAGNPSLSGAFSPTPAPAIKEPAPSVDIGKAFSITVEEGETLEDIARSYIVPVKEIRKLNNLPENAKLKAGETLMIPPGVY